MSYRYYAPLSIHKSRIYWENLAPVIIDLMNSRRSSEDDGNAFLKVALSSKYEKVDGKVIDQSIRMVRDYRYERWYCLTPMACRKNKWYE